MSIWRYLILSYYLRLQYKRLQCPFGFSNVQWMSIWMFIIFFYYLRLQCPFGFSNVHWDVHYTVLLHKTPMSIGIFQCPLGCSLLSSYIWLQYIRLQSPGNVHSNGVPKKLLHKTPIHKTRMSIECQCLECPWKFTKANFLLLTNAKKETKTMVNIILVLKVSPL